MSLSPLPIHQLRRVCDPESFNFETTAGLTPAADIIGQPRGTRAIEFGIDIDSPGYNIFVLGEEGTGRTTAIGRFLRERAAQRPTPQDWMYVNNFVEPHKPRALNLPAGMGAVLRDDMAARVKDLQRSLPQAFEQEAYLNARAQIRANYESQRDAIYTALQTRAAAARLTIMRAPNGWVIAPLSDGKPMPSEAFDALPDEAKQQFESARRAIEGELEDALRAARSLEKSAKESQRALDQQVAASVVDHRIDELKAKFAAHEETTLYLDEVRRDVVDHVDDFLPSEGEPTQTDPDPALKFRKYTVNLVVDHGKTQGAPVVVELNPIYSKLLGRIEHESRFGNLVTDFTLIKTGALHAANGGYLVLRAQDMFMEFLAWDALKRSLLSGYVRTEDIVTRMGVATTKTLDPEPIPLDLKVVLVGPAGAYYYLFEHDDGFSTLFKVKADFASDMPRTPDNERLYALFIAARCAEEKLRPFDRAAVAKVVEYGSRIEEDQRKLSARFGDIADLLREAHYWAEKSGRDVVTANDVIKALDEKIYRANKVEEMFRERILEGSVLIDTSGEAVGQINALSVSNPGDYAFALPSRVTARTFAGHGGISHLDRDTSMAGPIHNKGLLTLSSFFNATYAVHRSLAFSAQITFEQNYSNIEGDSASAAELCALLSSLSGYPIKQSLAITGSINQKGDIQPIGAVNEKIEGFLALCEARGLTGDQGVVVPARNVRDLMLNEKVVAAVESGKFSIWAVSTVDEAIELLTGVRAGERKDGRFSDKTVHHAVQKRLRDLAKGHDRERDPDEDEKKPPKKKQRAPKKRPTRRLSQ